MPELRYALNSYINHFYNKKWCIQALATANQLSTRNDQSKVICVYFFWGKSPFKTSDLGVMPTLKSVES